jgi:hypothetical protein
VTWQCTTTPMVTMNNQQRVDYTSGLNRPLKLTFCQKVTAQLTSSLKSTMPSRAPGNHTRTS